MRNATLTDLTLLARRLAMLPHEDRRTEAERIMHLAHVADHYRKNTGRIHSGLGNGSIAGVIGTDALPPECRTDSLDYLRAMSVACEALADRHDRHMTAQAAVTVLQAEQMGAW